MSAIATRNYIAASTASMLFMLLAGCSGANSVVGSDRTADPIGNGVPGLPVDSAVDVSLLAGRDAAAPAQMHQFGEFCFQSSPQCTPHDGVIDLNGSQEELSFAIWGFYGMIEADAPGNLKLQLNSPAPEGLYVALSDYSTGRWRIEQFPAGEAEHSFTVDPLTMLSESGRVYVAAIAHKTNATVDNLMLTSEFHHPPVQDVVATDGEFTDKVLVSWAPEPHIDDFCTVHFRPAGSDERFLVAGYTNGETTFEHMVSDPFEPAEPGVVYEYMVTRFRALVGFSEPSATDNGHLMP